MICQNCGIEFDPATRGSGKIRTPRGVKYCSIACRWNYHKQVKDTPGPARRPGQRINGGVRLLAPKDTQ